MLMAGSISAVFFFGWWVRRHHRVVDEFDNHDYEGPPPIHGQAGPH